jgi:hypothetical protein
MSHSFAKKIVLHAASAQVKNAKQWSPSAMSRTLQPDEFNVSAREAGRCQPSMWQPHPQVLHIDADWMMDIVFMVFKSASLPKRMRSVEIFPYSVKYSVTLF